MNKIKSNSLGYMMIFVTGLLWGTIGIFVKEMSLGGADALFISFLRVSLAFIAMLIVTVIRGGFKSLKISPRQMFQCALLGIICHGIYNIFYSYAVVMVGVSVSAALLNIAPVFTLAVSVVCFSEKLNKWKILAVFINIIGCTLTATSGRFDVTTLSAAGLLCGIGAGLSYGMTAIFGKFSTNDFDSFAASTYSYLFAAIVLLLPAKPWLISPNSDLTRIITAGLLLAFIPTAIAYILYYKGLSYITETSKAPIIASGESVVAALLGMIIYRERIGVIGWIGIAMVIISISLMNVKSKTK